MIEQSTHPYGPVAQLGERIVRNDEVAGSIPARSTMSPFTGFATEFQRNKLEPIPMQFMADGLRIRVTYLFHRRKSYRNALEPSRR